MLRNPNQASATVTFKARAIDRASLAHPYGDGNAGVRSAELLAAIDPRPLRCDFASCAHIEVGRSLAYLPVSVVFGPWSENELANGRVSYSP